MHSGAEIPSRTLFPDTPTILMVTLLPMSISSFNLRDRTSMIRIPLLKTGGLQLRGMPGSAGPVCPDSLAAAHTLRPQGLTSSIENQSAHQPSACTGNKKPLSKN
jgi:hypothetical protein